MAEFQTSTDIPMHFNQDAVIHSSNTGNAASTSNDGYTTSPRSLLFNFKMLCHFENISWSEVSAAMSSSTNRSIDEVGALIHRKVIQRRQVNSDKTFLSANASVVPPRYKAIIRGHYRLSVELIADSAELNLTEVDRLYTVQIKSIDVNAKSTSMYRIISHLSNKNVCDMNRLAKASITFKSNNSSKGSMKVNSAIERNLLFRIVEHISTHGVNILGETFQYFCCKEAKSGFYLLRNDDHRSGQSPESTWPTSLQSITQSASSLRQQLFGIAVL
jgi:hypothetical protein